MAVLRSFPSQVFGGPKCSQLTCQAEDLLIGRRACFQIVHDHQLGELERYRALVLAGCIALTDRQIEQIRQYVSGGGRLCVIGPAATHDQWMNPRPRPALDDLPASRVVRIPGQEDRLSAIRRACGGQFSLSVEAEPPQTAGAPPAAGQRPGGLPGLCAELTEQPGRRLVHLVNYRSDGPVKHIAVRLLLPVGRHVTSITLASPERAADRPVPFREEGGAVTFSVPEIGVYEIAVVAMQ